MTAPGLSAWEIAGTGDGTISGRLTAAPADADLDAVVPLYRKFSETSPVEWSEAPPIESPEIGSVFEIAGLDNGAVYEVTVSSMDESGNMSRPGNIMRAIPSADGIPEKILDAAAAELADWIPVSNIFRGAHPHGKVRMAERAAALKYAGAAVSREFSTCAVERHFVDIELFYEHRDRAQLLDELARMAGEITRRLDGNRSAFAAVDWLLDARIIQTGGARPAGDFGASASLKLEVLVAAESQ
jgi:hypothetical protein